MFSKNLKRLRENQGISQAELAEKLGVNKSEIISWEEGSAEPCIKLLCALADVLQISDDSLLGHSTAYDEDSLCDLDCKLYGEIDDLSAEEKKQVISFLENIKQKRI